MMQERQQGLRSKLSQLGDTPPEEFRKQLHELADWIADFREHLEQLRVAPNDNPGTLRAKLPERAPEEAEPFAKILSDVDRIIVPGMVHWSHPMFLGYFGWTSTAPEKAAIALGLGEENVIRVPSDDQFRMDVNSLGHNVAQDRQNGFQPMAVVATVGTTATASVDAIPEIAKICCEEKIWLHIDAAYGGGFAIVSEYKWLSNGWELADSVVINPHKTVFVPLDFSVLYVRGLERLRRVFMLVPEVLRGDTLEGEKNYSDYGIQLGRRFRALKAWVIWRSLGRDGIVARLREQIRLANLLADWINKDDRFELAAPVSMGVVCFRFVAGIDDAGPGSPTPATADKVDQSNSDIVERI